MQQDLFNDGPAVQAPRPKRGRRAKPPVPAPAPAPPPPVIQSPPRVVLIVRNQPRPPDPAPPADMGIPISAPADADAEPAPDAVIDVHGLLTSVMAALQDDPQSYLGFGVWWWPIKAMLRRFFNRDDWFGLGDYEDPAGVALVPALGLKKTLDEALQAFGVALGCDTWSPDSVAPGGEAYTLRDLDVEPEPEPQ